MQPVLLCEGTQPQRQACHQEQPADTVGWPPGSKDEAHDGDGQVYYLPEDLGDVPSHHVRWHQVPVRIRPRQPAGDQRYRHPCGASGHPSGCQDPHPYPPGTRIFCGASGRALPDRRVEEVGHVRQGGTGAARQIAEHSGNR